MQPQVILYRIGNFIHRKGLFRIARLMGYVNRIIFEYWLPSSAKIGYNVKLGYWGIGVVVHSNSVIVNNATIGQNVTIGRNFGDSKVPVIGNDVYIGTGSMLFGEIIVGDNVIIGCNSVVNKDIPSNSTVAGNPYKILKENRIEKYYELDKVRATTSK
ncbi:serine acetyltransferase [Nonlabens sp. MB-3u-79]|uniref:serine O-acetyltransferase n=1 Tax=Nonlabens sp. MB-3u-79 TaxID=2058134 RepID=UPI000C316C22|nr:serine acetyltransferase [Nonlabens sp. MB-3u-79]AUC79546.1 serine acetyltransferase [Nonlabens sp. MB-3u-79]